MMHELVRAIPYNVTDRISWPEIVWTFFASAGSILCGYYAWYSWRVYSGVSALYFVDGDRWLAERTVARGNIRRGLWRFSRQLVALAVGVWSMGQLNGPALTVGGFYIIVAFLYLEITMIVCSAGDHMEFTRINRMHS